MHLSGMTSKSLERMKFSIFKPVENQALAFSVPSFLHK